MVSPLFSIPALLSTGEPYLSRRIKYPRCLEGSLTTCTGITDSTGNFITSGLPKDCLLASSLTCSCKPSSLSYTSACLNMLSNALSNSSSLATVLPYISSFIVLCIVFSFSLPRLSRVRSSVMLIPRSASVISITSCFTLGLSSLVILNSSVPTVTLASSLPKNKCL